MHLAMFSMPEKIKRLNKLKVITDSFHKAQKKTLVSKQQDKMLLNLASLKKKKEERQDICFKRKGTHNYIPL